jgi:hypothetical protein
MSVMVLQQRLPFDRTFFVYRSESGDGWEQHGKKLRWIGIAPLDSESHQLTGFRVHVGNYAFLIARLKGGN